MPRGYLSVRIDTKNALHHIWLNNGAFWVHYTVHFGNRKRRIRRSLKTSDLHTAIARRDALFARIQSEGEEVSERRPGRKEADEEDRRMCVRSSCDPSASSFNVKQEIVTVSEHRKNNRSSKISRRSRIDHADRLFALGKGFAAKAEVVTSSATYWWRAATTFANAADHYRRANLGLMAKVAYRHASHCFAKGGSAGEASRCGALAEAFPVFWEEAKDV